MIAGARALALLAYATARALPGHLAHRPVAHPPLPDGGLR